MMQTDPVSKTATIPSSHASSEVRRAGAGSHRRVAGLHVLSLKGSFYEMGRQHGELLAAEVARGPIPYYERMVERLVGKPLGPLAPLFTAGLQRTVGARVARAMPDFALETIRGIAEGAGLSYAEMLRGCTMPDSLLWLVSRMIGARAPGPAVAHRLALGLGCTSAIAWGDATVDGKLYHARNFDYHGISNWPAHAAVLFHEPRRGQRYVSVGAAGVGLGGITAMNEAGLTLAVHQHMFTDRARLGGTPIGSIGDVVMREAKTLDDAARIFRAAKPIGSWTYLVADAKTKEVLCFEENPERKAPRRIPTSDGVFGYANIYLDDELGATEAAYYPSYWRHNQGRHARANELLRAQRGSLDARGVAGVLADTGDPRCRVRDSIAMAMTVGSVVFRPEDGALWVGTGEAPTSRGRFVPFSLETASHAPELGELDTTRPEDARADGAFEQFRLANVAYLDRGDVPAALSALDRARAIAPDQAVYHALAGMLAVEHGDAERATRALDEAIALGHPDEERVSAFYLWRGRAQDLAGRRDRARADYRACLGRRGDPPVHAAARKNLARAFTKRAARRVHAEMSLADVIVP